MSFPVLERHDLGNGIIAYNIGKRRMTAWAYRIGKTLIDSGAPNMSKELLPFILQDGDIEHIYLTHHHEDHSGGATTIRNETGAEITVSSYSQALIRKGYVQYPYQHVVWGRFQAFQENHCLELPAFESVSYKTNDGDFQVFHAPGHSHDMTVVYDAERKALFSADMYLSSRQRLMRRDENFFVSLETLKRIIKLNVEILLCGHRPVFSDGNEKLEKKLVFMETIQDKLEGNANERIETKLLDDLLGKEDSAFRLLSLGNVSRANLVKSLLGDVKARPDVVRTVGEKLAHYDFS